MTGEQLNREIRVEAVRPGDNGHNFSTQSTTEFQSGLNALIEQHPSSNGVSYNGPILLNLPVIKGTLSAPSFSSYLPSPSQITVDGTKLWSQAVPTATEVGLAAFLGELREGLPSLPGKISSGGAHPSKKVGSEYLNWKFGVQPLRSDLAKLVRGISEFHKRVRQFQRDSGRQVRRRRSLGESRREVDVLTSGTATGGKVWIPLLFGASDVFTTQLYSSPGSLSVRDIVEEETWFSGAYTYYLSEAHSFLGKLERYEELADHALGVEFDPNTAWQLTPWSWLVDWFSDAGSFIKNLTALSNDNVVARYAYVMHHRKVTRMYSVTGMRPRTGVTGPTTATAFETFESKTRTAATPYGFGLDHSAWSAGRWAILGALGMTRAPGVLRD